MLRNNADARQCSYFELGLPVLPCTWQEKVSPQSHSPFSVSLQTFRWTFRAFLTAKKYWLYYQLKLINAHLEVWVEVRMPLTLNLIQPFLVLLYQLFSYFRYLYLFSIMVCILARREGKGQPRYSRPIWVDNFFIPQTTILGCNKK